MANKAGIQEEEILELELTDIAHGGRCVGRFGETVVFVRGGIPGETVRARVTARKKNFWHASCVEVLSASEHRVVPKWAIGAVGNSGAADFGHIELGYQRKLKKKVIETQARRIGGEAFSQALSELSWQVEGMDDVDGWNTRTRVILTKFPTGFGMYREASHDLIQLDSMGLTSKKIEDLDLWGAAWDGKISPGEHVKVVAPSASETRVYIGNKAFNAAQEEIAPEVREVIELDGTKYEYELSGLGFWQVHYQAPTALVKRAFEFLGDVQGVKGVDLYSGAGLFSVPFADKIGPRGTLMAVESVDPAVQAANKNLAKYPWAFARTARISEKNVASLVKDAEVVIADPARAGLGVETAEILARSNAEKIILVSCDAASMARDVSTMLAAGRTLSAFTALDIFPQTHHVECVALLVKA
ncbi:MAG: TRAM domain-containing protein [Arcanobacterium sp.]|nr:TRAM domain-containing protein [Arcanobacterium sp.]